MTNILPKWANDEWCIENDNNPNCATYLNLTNVDGGNSSGLNWLDFSCTSPTNCSFEWSKNPKYSWYLTPNTNTSNQSKMFMWDNTLSGNKNSTTLRSNLTSPISFDSNLSCVSSNYSNIDKCEVGHNNSTQHSWSPQTWGTGPTESSCHSSTECNKDTDSTCQQYWSRAISSTGSHGGTFCNQINQYGYSSTTGERSCNPRAFLFSGIVPDEDGPADNPGKEGEYYNNGCGIYYCGNTTDFYDTCNTAAKTDLNASSWISDNSAMACCAQPKSNVYAYPQCGTTDSPGAFSSFAAGSKCPELMNNKCENIWPTCASSTSNCTTGQNYLCQNYLKQGGNSAISSSRTMITNYVNSASRESTPNYVSWNLRNNGDPVSNNYYSTYQCDKDPSNYPSSNPCSRDDSKDPFFTQQLYYYCNTPETGKCSGALGNPNGNCDDILHYMCQNFDRSSLEADPTLAKMCGCYLMSTSQAQSGKPYSKPDSRWITQLGTPQKTSPYYQDIPDGNACDSLCMTANGYSDSIVPCSGKCISNTCLMDNITLNYYNTNAGNVTLEQACGNCGTTPGSGQCVCYMNDITINSINSSFGNTDLSQTCGTCYYIDQATNEPYQVDCQTGEPISNIPTQPTKKKVPFWRKKLFIILMSILFMFLIIFLIVWYSSYTKYKTNLPGEDYSSINLDDYYYV